MSDKVNILTVKFNNQLAFSEIPLFRGALIHTIKGADVLFHNHVGNSFRYRYPLIQYKRVQRHACVVCIAEGAETFGEFFNRGDFSLQIGKRNENMEIASINAHKEVIQIWDSMFEYYLNNWLALNQENYNKYLQMEGLAEKMLFLQKTLIANILSMAKTLNIHFNKNVNVVISSIDLPHSTLYKGVQLISFNLRFKTNVSLPDYIGLGKGCSIGYGTIHRVRQKEQYE